MRKYVGRSVGSEKKVAILIEMQLRPPPGDAPFDWGNMGSGAASLAWSILRDASDIDTAEAFSQDFKREVVDRLGEDWELTYESVKEWLDAKKGNR